MVKTINRFTAALNMVPKKGWAVLHVDVEDDPFYIQYDTQEEFQKDFSVYMHPLYKCVYVEPKNIVNDWGGDSVDISIKGGTQEVYLNTRCLHLVVDGTKQRIV